MPNENVPMGYTWDQRRNAFNVNDDCYECGPCPNESDVCTSGERAFKCLARCHAGYSYIDAEAGCTCSGTDCIVNGKCFELLSLFLLNLSLQKSGSLTQLTRWMFFQRGCTL